MTARLEGARLVLTRPTGPDDALAARLAAAGARVLAFPALRLAALPGAVPPGDFDLAVFVSPAAVMNGYPRVALRPPPRFAAVGAGTARRLAAVSPHPVVAPTAGAGIAALLENPAVGDLRGRRVLLVCGRPLNRRSARALADRGARVTPFAAYARRPASDPEPLAGWIAAGEADAIMVSSVAAVQALGALLGAEFARVAWICSSARVAAAVERAGATPAAVAASAADADFATAAIHWWQAGRKRDDA